MATANPAETTPTDELIFDFIREEIIVAFDRIITEVKSRRDQLLSEIEDRRRELKNSAMFDSVRELEDMRSNLEMSVKQNVAMKRQQESLADLDSEINKLRADINRSTQLKYSCSLDQLIQQIKKFGEIIDTTSHLTLAKAKYSRKLTAAKVIEGFESAYSMRLHIDPYKELLYVTHSGSKTVLVYNAEDFKFIQEFGDTEYPPKSVASSKEFIYVISPDEILQYKSSDFALVETIYASFSHWGNFYICIGNSDVLVWDNRGSIKVYDRALDLEEDIKLDLEKYSKPYYRECLSMITRENMLYILLANKILLFVPFGDWNNISCYFKKQEGKIPYVTDPSVFCIDSAGNVIVADACTCSIKFLSPEGDLIHTIGESIVGSDDIRRCSDIAVYKNSVIVACRDPVTKQYIIRIY